jgi:polar amino acid transport system substrate-binding protein
MRVIRVTLNGDTIMKKSFIVLLSLCLILSAKESIHIVTDFWEDYTEKDGTGYYFDMLRLAYPEADYEFQITYVPFNRGVVMIEGGEADVLLGTYAEDAAGLNTAYPVEIDMVDLAVLNEKAAGLETLDDLTDLTVGARLGYELDEFLVEGTDYKEFRSVNQMFKMLAAGRIDGVLDYMADMQEPIAEAGLEEKVSFVPAIIKSETFFTYHPTKAELKTIFDTAFELAYKDGRLEALAMEYMETTDILPQL